MTYFLLCTKGGPFDCNRFESFSSSRAAEERIPDLLKEGWLIRVVEGNEIPFKSLEIVTAVRLVGAIDE